MLQQESEIPLERLLESLPPEMLEERSDESMAESRSDDSSEEDVDSDEEAANARLVYFSQMVRKQFKLNLADARLGLNFVFMSWPEN